MKSTKHSASKVRKATWTSIFLVATMVIPAMGMATAPTGVTETIIPVSGYPASTARYGDILAVGNYHISGTNVGRVLVYHKNAEGAWDLEATIVDPDGVQYGYFGSSVDLGNNTLVVGAFESYLGRTCGRGNAYIFERTAPGVWQFKARFDQSVANSRCMGYLGLDVDVSDDGTRAMASASGPQGTGGAFLNLYRQNGNWFYLADWTISNYVGLDLSGDGNFAVSAVYYNGGYWTNPSFIVHDLRSGGRNIYSLPIAYAYAPTYTISGNDLFAATSEGSGKIYRYTLNANGSPTLVETITGINGYHVIALSKDVFAQRATESSGATKVWARGPAGFTLVDTITPQQSAGYAVGWEGTELVMHHYYGSEAGVHLYEFDGDGDRLAKWTEVQIGTNPTDADSDDDFWGDGTEYLDCGTSPTDMMSFPTPGCTGDLPDEFSLSGGPAPGVVATVVTTVRGPIAGVDTDGDFVLDASESRLCGTSATAGAIAAANGALGACVSSSDHEIAGNPLRDPVGTLADATGDVQTAYDDLDAREARGLLPNGVSLWEPICMLEDANSPDDGSCTGSGATSSYTPPSA